MARLELGQYREGPFMVDWGLILHARQPYCGRKAIGFNLYPGYIWKEERQHQVTTMIDLEINLLWIVLEIIIRRRKNYITNRFRT